MDRIKELVAAAFDARHAGYMVRYNRYNLATPSRSGVDGIKDKVTNPAWRELAEADKEQATAHKKVGAARSDLEFAEAHGAKADEYIQAALNRARDAEDKANEKGAEAEEIRKDINLALPQDRTELLRKAGGLSSEEDSYLEERQAWYNECSTWENVQAYLDGGDAQ